MTLPPGWTDDLNVPLPPGRTAKQVAQFVIRAGLNGTADDENERLLIAEFQLSPDDAALARDRAYGGLVRAAAEDSANCPDRKKDPIAWHSYHLALCDPGIVARIYPQFARPKPTWRDFLSALFDIPRLLRWEFQKWRGRRKELREERNLRRRMTELARAGKSVEAMKLYRELTGASLDDAKAWLEVQRRAGSCPERHGM